MQKIKKVILENFQSHKYTELDFNENLNIIVGETDSGKTAIFRALKWALYNEPQGDYFIREGKNDVSVSVYFTSGHIIKRSRTKSKNRYEIIYPDENSQVFEGFGSSVPREVTQISKMPKLNIGGRENRAVNLSEQLDPPFLLSESPSIKALAIGKLVEADIVDNALSTVNIDLKNYNRDKSSLSEEIKSIKSDLEEFNYLDKLEEDIKKLEEINDKIKKLEDRKNFLERLLSIYSEVEKEIEVRRNLLENLDFINELELLYSKLELKSSELKSLDNKNNIYTKIKTDLNDKSETIERLKYIEEVYDNSIILDFNIKKLNKISNLKSEKSTLEKRIIKGEQVLARLSFLDSEDLDKKVDLNELYRLNRLNELKNEYLNNKNRIAKGENYIKNYENLDKAQIFKKDLEEKLNIYENLLKNKKNLLDVDNNIEKINNCINLYSDNIKSLEDNYISTMKNLKICPTCSHRLDDHDYESLKKHLGS